MLDRRGFIAGFLVALSGCLSRDRGEPDYSMTDLVVVNKLDRAVTITITLEYEGGPNPPDEVIFDLGPDSRVERDEVPFFDTPGHVTVSVDGSETFSDVQEDWRGDTTADNYQLYIQIGRDGPEINVHVS